MSLCSMHTQQFPKTNKQRMTDVDPSNPVENRTNNYQSNLRLQTLRAPVLDSNFYHTQDPTETIKIV